MEKPNRSIAIVEQRLAKIHAALRTQAFFPLHRFGVGPEFAEWKASIFRKDKMETERLFRQNSNRRHIKSIVSSKVTLISHSAVGRRAVSPNVTNWRTLSSIRMTVPTNNIQYPGP